MKKFRPHENHNYTQNASEINDDGTRRIRKKTFLYLDNSSTLTFFNCVLKIVDSIQPFLRIHLFTTNSLQPFI